MFDLETKTDDLFEGVIYVKYLKVWVVTVLLITLSVAFLYEVLTCILLQVGASPTFLPNQCVHIIGLNLVSEATTFSYSLTAFLLVAVTVVFAVEKQVTLQDNEKGDNGEKKPPNDDFPDGGLRFVVTDSNPNKTESDYPTTYEFIDTTDIEYQEGEQKRGEGGNGPYWGLVGHSGEALYVEEFSSEPLYRFGTGLYVLYHRDALSDGEIANFEGKKWEIYPRFETGRHILIKIQGPDMSPGDTNNDEPESTNSEDEDDSETITIEKFGQKLKKSLSYSLSASLLGTLILGFTPPPIIIRYTEVPIAPIVVEIMSPFFFTTAVYIFTFLFLGMISTSIGLIDLMVATTYSE